MISTEINNEALVDYGESVQKNTTPYSRYALVITITSVLIGVLLRFIIISPMWLDEAQAVSIAKLNFPAMINALKHDGAPPLYYILLHWWMNLFGDSTFSDRALSGLFGCLAMPFILRLSSMFRSAYSRKAFLVIYSLSSFGIYYGTEARMYALIIFETSIAAVLVKSYLLKRSYTKLLGISLVTTCLLYTHYWSFYLLTSSLLILWAGALLEKEWRSDCIKLSIFALLGSIPFLFWLPEFVYQLKHTGTPWAQPTGFTAVVHTITQFAGGDSLPGRLLAICFFTLILLAITGKATAPYKTELYFKTRPGVRLIGVMVLATLSFAVAGGILSHSAYSDRYTAVTFIFTLLVVSYGLSALGGEALKLIFLVLLSIFSFFSAIPNVYQQRSEAQLVAMHIRNYPATKNLVIYCPDQLGPAVSRLLPSEYKQFVFPTMGNPHIVDWVNYAERNGSVNSNEFAEKVLTQFPQYGILYVWEEGYLTFGHNCENMLGNFVAARGSFKQLVADQPQQYYEHEHLDYIP